MVKKQPKSGKDFVRLARKSDKVASVRPGKGSHMVIKFKNGSSVSVPVHGNKQLAKGIRYNIIKVFKAAGALELILLFFETNF